MTRERQTINNEEGSVLLLALVLLVLITIAGLGALTSTTTEIQIAGNDRCFKQNLTRAESAIYEVVQVMKNETTPLTNLIPTASAPTWLHAEGDGFDPLTSDWIYATNAVNSALFADNRSGYTSIYGGVAPGASLDMSSSSTMRQFEIYGRSELCNGLVDVIAGYRIRF